MKFASGFEIFNIVKKSLAAMASTTAACSTPRSKRPFGMRKAAVGPWSPIAATACAPGGGPGQRHFNPKLARIKGMESFAGESFTPRGGTTMLISPASGRYHWYRRDGGAGDPEIAKWSANFTCFSARPRRLMCDQRATAEEIAAWSQSPAGARAENGWPKSPPGARRSRAMTIISPAGSPILKSANPMAANCRRKS